MDILQRYRDTHSDSVLREDLQPAFGGPMEIITSDSTISYKLLLNHWQEILQ